MPSVKTKNSLTTTNVPANASLLQGELAVNITDQKLWVGDSSGNPIIISDYNALGGSSVTMSTTAPSSPSDGDLWFDTERGNFNVWYVDGTSDQWVTIGGVTALSGPTVHDTPVDAATTTSISSNWAYDHENAADPHTVYPLDTEVLKKDGSVALTADWDAGSFDITALQLHSDITTGTAPFTVASTTVVTNLNADQVDGNDASDIVLKTDVDDTPVDAATTVPISSNWAYDLINGTQSIIGQWSFNDSVIIQDGFLSLNASGLSATQNFYMSRDAGYSANTYLRTGSVIRWGYGVDSSAESGSDVGSNFYIGRFNDAGTYQDSPIVINRATGDVTIANDLSVNGTALVDTYQPHGALTGRNYQSGTTYTLVASDAGKMVECDNASAITVTVNNSVFAENDIVHIHQLGAGQVTVSAGAGVTFLKQSTFNAKTFEQYAIITLYFRSASSVLLGGSLEVA